MSQETVKIYATKSCEVDTHFVNNTEKNAILYAYVGDSYSETPYIGFDIDFSKIPDDFSFNFYADNSIYSKITTANGYWDETTMLKDMPGYTSHDSDQKISIGLNTLTGITKEQASNGFVIYRYENGGPTYVYSTRYSDESKRPYIEYVKYTPVARDLDVIGTSIDSNIVCQWENEDVLSLKVEVLKNDILIATKTGTTENTVTFVPGDINVTGKVTFKLTVYNGDSSNEYTKEVDLTGTQVKILSIEPNSIPQKLYNPIELKVIGENMTNIVIECVQNGVIKYSDTISNNLLDTVTSTVLANTFTSGTVTLKVTATYQSTYYSNTTTQTVTFTAYGPPKTPILDVQSEYATPSPLISWTLDSEQIEYEVTLNGVIVKDVYSSKINSYQCVDLSNNTYNTIKVRIKNSYNEWSDYAIATFLVSFAELEQPLIHAYSDVQNTCITIVFSSVEQEQFLKHAIYRKKSTETTWQKMKDNLSRESKYSDYCCGSGISYDYKVRALSSIGTFRDSEIVQASVTLSNRVLSVPGEDIFIELTGFETINDSLADIAFNSNSSYLGICGLTVPKRVSSTQKYKSFSCKCCFETQEAYENFLALEEKEILLYRDGKGEAFYCTIQITGTTDSLEYYKYISFVVTETYYSGVEYDKPIYFGYSKREW